MLFGGAVGGLPDYFRLADKPGVDRFRQHCAVLWVPSAYDDCLDCAEGALQLTIAGASWIRSSFSRASTIKRAKSTRRVMLLLSMGSPTCRLQTGRPWLSPSSRALPRTTVHRVSLPKTLRHASTWSSRSTTRSSRASHADALTKALKVHAYTSCPSRVICQPQEKMRRAPRGAQSRTAWAAPDEY